MVLDGKSSREYPVNAGVSQGSILSPTLFLLHINDTPGDVICDTAIYPDDTTLYSSVIRHMICGNNLNWLLNLNLICEILWTWTKRGLLISILGKQLILFDQSNNTSSEVKVDGSVLEEKSSYKMLQFTFS